MMNGSFAGNDDYKSKLKNCNPSSRCQPCARYRGPFQHLKVLNRDSMSSCLRRYITFPILIFLSALYLSETVAASSAASKSASAPRTLKEEKQAKTIPTSSLVKNPFRKERTIVSGFGSRSIKKTIFSHRSSKRKKKLKEEQDESDDEYEGLADEKSFHLPKLVSPKMWVQRSKYSNSYNDDDDALWMLIRGEDESNEDGSQTKSRSSSNSSSTEIILKLTFDPEIDDWVAKQVTKREAAEFVRDHPLDDWIQINGLYGNYRVPSGVLWVLITGTEPIYDAPPISSSLSSSSWWQIRRVTNLEIVHLGRKGCMGPELTEAWSGDTVTSKSTGLTPSRLREEVRQLHLLRKALKQHEFYFIPKNSQTRYEDKIGHSENTIIDMTKTIQRSILESNRSDKGESKWWKPSGNGSNCTCPSPDPRFFWNQHAVDSILKRCQAETGSPDEDHQRKLAELLMEHVIPVTSAFVGVKKNITMNTNESGTGAPSVSYDQLLISRRSRFRAGTRFTVRGADAAGNCANFAETEQVCLMTRTHNSGTDDKDGSATNNRCLESIASHVQTRGSIPLRWSSPADVKTYRPRVNIGVDPLAQARATRLHILDQLRLYTLQNDIEIDSAPSFKKMNRSPGVADLVFVNLVDKHSDQGRLGRTFDAVLRAVVDIHMEESKGLEDRPSSTDGNQKAGPVDTIRANAVKHVWYDFHAEVKNGRWDRLGMLLDEVKPSLSNHTYFHAKPIGDTQVENTRSKGSRWSIQRLQNAVVRTNCMDCLDRTNVVQSIFGRFMLFQQLSDEAGDTNRDSEVWTKLKALFQKESLKLPWEMGEVSHRLLWADNADAISRLYAGTPALKGDFTRTGKRTKKGALDDGMNSLQRYYLNNFLDADRQEGYDLLVGHTAFSHVLEESSTGSDEIANESVSNPFHSLFGAARENILGDVVRGEVYKSREDLRDRLEEIGISKESDLDLRWLPGDLQAQLRNQARGSTSSLTEDTEKIETKVTSKETTWEFCSQQAMKAIDERSHAELPWWTKSEGNWLLIDDIDDDVESSDISTTASNQHQSQVILTPTQLAMVFYLGVRSPSILESLAILVLGFAYLPDCIKHDHQKQKSMKVRIKEIMKQGE